MTNREKIRKKYPKARSNRLAPWLVHIRSGTDRDATLGWGNTYKSAWKNAVDKVLT